MLGVKLFGIGRWASISQLLPGRTSNATKMRYRSLSSASEKTRKIDADAEGKARNRRLRYSFKGANFPKSSLESKKAKSCKRLPEDTRETVALQLEQVRIAREKLEADSKLPMKLVKKHRFLPPNEVSVKAYRKLIDYKKVLFDTVNEAAGNTLCHSQSAVSAPEKSASSTIEVVASTSQEPDESEEDEDPFSLYNLAFDSSFFWAALLNNIAKAKSGTTDGGGDSIDEEHVVDDSSVEENDDCNVTEEEGSDPPATHGIDAIENYTGLVVRQARDTKGRGGCLGCEADYERSAIKTCSSPSASRERSSRATAEKDRWNDDEHNSQLQSRKPL
ncbi:unnamed protein product [Soboliphyme baturini]|uniref:HTH myb-type domain-containing protein n=1 Tax=Soboliphyme baturini TaxID=241478 RepID=A0A183IU33_9BILA|nr:unnamed protein product [Soboliphyme baturini]